MAAQTSVTLRVVSNRLPAVTREIDQAVKDEVERAGYDVEAAAKAKSPVRTGTLRRSIHTVVSSDGTTATVGPSVEYGIYPEFGTRHMPAHPYMRPAFEMVMPKFLDRLKAAIKRSSS